MSKYRIVKDGTYYTVQEQREYLDDSLAVIGVQASIQVGWKPVKALRFINQMNKLGIKCPEGLVLHCKWPPSAYHLGSEAFNHHTSIDSAHLLIDFLIEYRDNGVYTNVRQFLPLKEQVVSEPHLIEVRIHDLRHR